MFHIERMFFAFLGFVMVVIASSCAAEPIKIPLAATVIYDTLFMEPSMLLDNRLPPGWLRFDDENPTKTLTIGGVECTISAQTPANMPDDNAVPAKLILKAHTQELIFEGTDNEEDVKNKTMQLTLADGRKYPLVGHGWTVPYTNRKTGKKSVQTMGEINHVSIQTGQIPPPFQTPITLIDINMDGYYTLGEDCIAIGKPFKFENNPFHIAQPLSKYISTPDGIFKIQNLAKNGSELTLLPYTGPTATLQIITPTPKYTGYIILISSDTGLNVMIRSNAEGGKGEGEAVTVIPGSYKILFASLRLDTQTPSSIGITSTAIPALQIKPNANHILTLSGPKILEFQAALVDGKINIKPDTIHIKGLAGETYRDPINYRENQPEIFLNIDGNSISLGKMEYG